MEYVIVAVPLEIPVTSPLEELTLAIPDALLIHVPPGAASVKVTVAPWHNVDGPDMGDNGSTTTDAVI